MDELSLVPLGNLPNFDLHIDPITPEKLPDTDDKQKRRRPMNAFLLFCKDKREEVRIQNPNLKNVEISTILAEQWRNLEESEKEKYKQNYAEQQQIFKQDFPDYRYEKSHSKRNDMKNRINQTKPIFNVLDVKTLVSMPPEEIKTYIYFLSSQSVDPQNQQEVAPHLVENFHDERMIGDMFTPNHT